MTDLVPTQLGFVDPKTGKLVSSVRGLPGARRWNPETNVFTPPLETTEKHSKPTPVVKEPVVATEAVEPAVASEPAAEAPAKKKPGRPPGSGKK